MSRRKNSYTRNEINENIDKTKQEMTEKEIDLEKISSDVKTVRHTLESLDFEGTLEGSEEIEKSIEDAKDITIDVFEEEDENLEAVQEKGKEFEGELNDSQESSEKDMEKISQTESKVDTRETINELIKAKEAALKDINYLEKHVELARTAREKSDAVQEKLRAIVRYGGGE